MHPLVSIGLSTLPDLISLLDDTTDTTTSKKIARVVESVSGSAEPQSIRQALQADMALEARLKLALATLQTDLERERLTAQVNHAKESQQAALSKLDRHLKDQREARTAFSSLAALNSPFAWGPVVVSLIVTLGFFGILSGLLVLWRTPMEASNREAFQLLNIAIGALTAGFATVISFWLGSSQGSRAKDASLAAYPGAPQPTPMNPSPPLPTGPQGTNTMDLNPSRFDACMDIVFEHEGGFANHPDDPGGATNFGITLETLRAWRDDASVTAQDVRDLTAKEARSIYRARYWQAMNCDALRAGMDLVVFDFGVNAGPSRASKMLQRLLGTQVDGVIGPETIAAVEEQPIPTLIDRYSTARLRYYEQLPHFQSFGNGWKRRTELTRRAAINMIR